MDYTQLQAAVADFLNRGDLAAQIPTFIRLAEAQMQRDIRHWRNERIVDLSVSSRLTPLPDDYVEMMRLTEESPLGLLTSDEMRRKRQSHPGPGRPLWYAISGGQLEVHPILAEPVTLEATYRARLPALETTSTNWVSEFAPDAYLYGSLIASAPFLVEDERLAVWSSLYQSAIAALNADSIAGQFTGRLVMRSHYG